MKFGKSVMQLGINENWPQQPPAQEMEQRRQPEPVVAGGAGSAGGVVDEERPPHPEALRVAQDVDGAGARGFEPHPPSNPRKPGQLTRRPAPRQAN